MGLAGLGTAPSPVRSIFILLTLLQEATAGICWTCALGMAIWNLPWSRSEPWH